MKKCLIKNKTNQMNYFKITNFFFIKFPIITRWGTFLNCCNFIFQNFELIKDFVVHLDPQEYQSLIKTIDDENLICQLKCVADYIFIADTIKFLESSALYVYQQNL